MPTYHKHQPRLKCGEVFIWDCVGELFAIECQLCDERPLCTLSEFAEHMDVWHYDWTAEAHASLPDMPDTTTMSDGETSSYQHWASASASELMYASSIAPTERRDSLSDDNNEFESEYYEESTDKTVAEVDMEIEVPMENGSSQHTTTMVYESDESATLASTPCEAIASSSVRFEDELMIDATADISNALPTTSNVCNNVVRASVVAQNVDKHKDEDDEEIPANGVETSTSKKNLFVKEDVEYTVRQSLRTQKLIEIYEKFPELWHKQRNIMNTEIQAKAYHSISRELSQHGINLKPATIQRRLDALRRRYRLEKLEELTKLLEGHSYKSSFEFFEHLQFLKHHIEPQLCNICKRLCKDAAECCKRSLIISTGKQDVHSSEVTESSQQEQYTATNGQVNENQENSEKTKANNGMMQFESEEMQVTSDGATTTESIIANEVDVRLTNQHECDGNELEAPAILVAIPTAVSVVTYSFQSEIENLENAQTAIQASFVQDRLPVKDTQETSFIEQSFVVNESQETNFVQHIVSETEPQEPSFDQHSVSEIEHQEILSSVQHSVEATEPFVQQNLTETEPQGTFIVQQSLPQNEPPETQFIQQCVQDLEHQEILSVEGTEPFVQQNLTGTEPQETFIVQQSLPQNEPSETQFIQQCVQDLEHQEIPFIQHNLPGTESQEMPLIQHCAPMIDQPGTAQTEPQQTLFVQQSLTETEPQETSRPLQSKNKIEILEVIELPAAHNFIAQEQEVSTSNIVINQVEMIHENTSNKRLDLMNNADENMASEEYESSNGDSGILRDFEEQCDAQKPNKRTKKHKTATFARLTTEQARKLIKLYEQFPILWDPDHSYYNTRERRRKAWNQITTQINEALKTHYTWTTVHRKMHDYVKYYRKERQRIESEGGRTRWFFYDDFAFLNEVLAEQSSDVQKLLLNKIQNRKIIDIYYKHPQLWDTNHNEYKRRCIRQGLFKSMSEQLQSIHNITITPIKLKQRLVEFRCTYRMEKERRYSAEQQGETYTATYDYYEQLNFLDRHVAPFICDKCGAQYKKHNDMLRHIQQEHSNKKKLKNPPTPPPRTTAEKRAAALKNVCHICGNGFTLRRTLLCHIRRHNIPPPHACATCPRRFFDTATLRIHERSHTKSRPFICEQCGASYASGSKLNQHIKRHSNQRDHPCHLCGKAFYSAFECERHMRTHINVREKVCPVCGKDFAVGSGYYAHMLLHADVKRYKCQLCSAEFAQFAGLYKHRRRYHPAEFAMDKAKRMGEFVEEKQEDGCTE